MIKRVSEKRDMRESKFSRKRLKEADMLFGPNGQVYHADESKRFNGIPNNIKNLFKESSIDDAWDKYDTCLEFLGAEELCDALAKAMGTDELNDLLDYIIRTYEIPTDEDDYHLTESIKRTSRFRR